MKVYIHNKTIKRASKHGNYKILNNALKEAKKNQKYWKQNNITWMTCWIGEN